MRIDKFLKMSRVIKRRSVVKPSFDVKQGDVIEIQFGDKMSKFEILSIPKVQNESIENIIKLV